MFFFEITGLSVQNTVARKVKAFFTKMAAKATLIPTAPFIKVAELKKIYTMVHILHVNVATHNSVFIFN